MTEMVFILDRSGSMFGLEKDTIGGFNSMIEKQKREPGEALVSTVLFNTESAVVHDRVPLEKLREMTQADYIPAGCTALLDALGNAVRHIGNVHKYARKEDVPEKTVFVIITDGLENASRHYTYDAVRKLIERQKEKYGWEFIFLGANIDAAAEAAKCGISAEYAVDYCCDARGTELNFEALNDAFWDIRRDVNAKLKTSWRARIDEDHKKRG